MLEALYARRLGSGLVSARFELPAPGWIGRTGVPGAQVAASCELLSFTDLTSSSFAHSSGRKRRMTTVDLDRGGALSRACKLSGSRLRLNADIKLSKPPIAYCRDWAGGTVVGLRCFAQMFDQREPVQCQNMRSTIFTS